VLVPPLGEGSLQMLVDIVDESNILPQCIEAYQTNIEGFGHRLELIQALADEHPDQDDVPPGADQEAARLEEFFTYAYTEGSFVDLRKRTRYDMEVCGFGAWEVIRNVKGEIERLNHVPAHTLRMTVFDKEIVATKEKRRIGGKIKEVVLSRRFRTYVQIQTTAGRRETVWFKSFLDPRAMNPKTGEWLTVPGKAANEIIIWPGRYHPKSPYGVPRWVGNLTSVLGSRASEEVNLLYFDNKAIPPMVVLVSGGRLTKGSIAKLERTIQNEIKGRGNFHNILVLEAQPVGGGASDATVKAPRIEMRPLTDAQLRDAMFMEYDNTNRTKSRSSFRLPPLFVGQSDDYTRATAEASAHMAEEQVYRPERVGFDYKMNRWVLPELGSYMYDFKSNGPNVTLNEDLIQVLATAETAGAMTPNIGRTILADILERSISQIPAAEGWGDLPFSMTIEQMKEAVAQLTSGLGGFGGGNEPPPEKQLPPEKIAAMAQAAIARALPKGVRGAVLAEAARAVKAELARRMGKTRIAPNVRPGASAIIAAVGGDENE